MKFTNEEWDVIIQAVAGIGDSFSEKDALDLSAWIKKAMYNEIMAQLILKGELYAKVHTDGELICRKTKKFEDRMMKSKKLKEGAK